MLKFLTLKGGKGTLKGAIESESEIFSVMFDSL